MDYTLPDGTVIDINDISEVSEIKDYGSDDKTISESTLSFTIRFSSEHSVKVSRNYHFAEWFDIFKELKSTRNEILDLWEKHKQKKS